MTVSDATLGWPPVRPVSRIRATVPWLTTLPAAATVRLSTLLTKSVAVAPPSPAVMSQGPATGGPATVCRTRPLASRASRQPALAVAAIPSVVGRLPTTTQPERSATSAVVSPMPPGQRPGSPPVGLRDDRRAGALQVAFVVEVADEHVAAVQPADGARHDGDAVRVHVAIRGHGRCQRRVLMQRGEERLVSRRLRRGGGRGAEGGDAEDGRRPGGPGASVHVCSSPRAGGCL